MTFPGFNNIFSLDVRERASLELREVTRSQRSRTVYYELIGPSGPPFVGLRDIAPHSGWICDDCGYRCFGYSRIGFDLHDFIAAFNTGLSGSGTISHAVEHQPGVVIVTI